MASLAALSRDAAQVESMVEYRTLTTLVPRVAAATLLIMVLGTYATNNQVTGDFNKAIYFAVLILSFGLTTVFVRRLRPAPFDAAIAFVATLGLMWGIWTIERPQLLPSGYWEGFGTKVALGTLFLLVVLGGVLYPRHLSPRVRVVVGLLVGICCLADLLGAIRTFDFMTYVSNNLNEINDMLGPVAGKVPDSTYIPQYVALYGWLFVPLKHVLSPPAMVGLMAILLTILDIATVLIAISLVRRGLGSSGLLLAAALIVPITYVTSRVGGSASSIASLFQELPIRLFAGFFVLAIGINDLVGLYRGIFRVRRLLLIGVACAIAAWNSQDFGVAAAIVYGIMVLLGAAPSVRWRAVGAWVGGLCAGALAYPLFLLAVGSPLNFTFVAGFVKYFGSGLGSAPIQVPGPVLIVVPVVMCSTGAGWALMRLRRQDKVHDDALLDRAAVSLTFVGTWSALCLLYYVNRAYASGQLQTMLLSCGVCIALLASIVIHTPEFTTAFRPKPDGKVWQWLYAKSTMLPVGVFVCLGFSSVLLTPNPVSAATALVSSSAANRYTSYDLPQILAAVDVAKRYVVTRGGSLTYLGESFNYVALVTQVTSNAVLFPFPYPLGPPGPLTQIDCQYLALHHSKWIVLSQDAVEGFGTHVCGMYGAVPLSGVAFGQLQELK